MRLNQSTPVRAANDDHLIPLINIVFLMLIFFMIAGRIVPTDPLAIDPPRSSLEQPAQPEDIRLLMNSDGLIALNDEIVTPENLATRLIQLLSGKAATEQPGIALKVDADLPASKLNRILNALREAQAAKVTLYTVRSNP